MSNYSIGANFERRLMKVMEAEGWDTFRSAGSHKAADVLCVRIGEVRAFQCQVNKYFSQPKEEALIDLCRRNNWQAWLCWREGKVLKTEQIY